MAEPIIAPQGVPEQEMISFILNGESLTQRSKFSFENAIKRKDPEHVPSNYQRMIKQAHRYCRKIENPINKRTGKPLKASTLKLYQSQANSYKRSAKELKQVIRLLIFYGYLGQDKTRARWVREFRLYQASQANPVDYLKGLDGIEKRFVEVYDGKTTLAARQAGYSGNYISVKLSGREVIKKPKIQDALKLKTTHKMKQAGITVVHGGGQGDGRPFNTKPDDMGNSKVVKLPSYIKDIYERLDERRERLWEKVKSTSPRDQDFDMSFYLLNLQREVYDLDRGDGEKEWDEIKDSYEAVDKKLMECERKLGLTRGSYKGY